MRKFFTKKEAKTSSQKTEAATSTSTSYHFPIAAIFFAIVGVASELVDAIFLKTTLAAGISGIQEWQAWAISLIVGAACYASMAMIGYFRGRHMVNKCKHEWVGYLTWFAAGLALVLVRLWFSGLGNIVIKTLSGTDVMQTMSQSAIDDFTMNSGIAVLQFVLYLGTGFMSRDSAAEISNGNFWAYQKAKKQYEELLETLEEERQELIAGISILQMYPEFADRLIRSKASTKNNIAEYNKSSRAMIEAKMASNVSPDLMTDMYDKAMARAQRI